MTRFHLALIAAVIAGAVSGPLVSRAVLPQIPNGQQDQETGDDSSLPPAPEAVRSASPQPKTGNSKEQATDVAQSENKQSPSSSHETAELPSQTPRPTEEAQTPDRPPVAAAQSSQTSSTTKILPVPGSQSKSVERWQQPPPANRNATDQESLDLTRELATASRKINASLPRMITRDTRLDTTIPGPNRLTFVHTLVRFAKKDVDIAQIRRMVRSRLLSDYKSNDAMRELREHNVELQYRYKDKYGMFLCDVTVSPKDF